MAVVTDAQACLDRIGEPRYRDPSGGLGATTRQAHRRKR
jgi:hypothetical protein